MSGCLRSSVCVSIVHYCAKELLERCLNSFSQFPPSVPYRIVIADNSADQFSIRDMVEKHPHSILKEMPGNIGFSAANNRAVEDAEERYLFFLNPDSEIRDSTLELLIDRLESSPEIGMVGPGIEDSEGNIQFSCRAFPGYSTFLGHRYSLLTRWFPLNPISADYLQSGRSHTEARCVDWVSGAAMLMRRSDFEDLKGFDESFFLYAEDVDLCYRLHKEGRTIVYEPGAVVRHRVGGSSSRNRYRALWERHRSMYTFYRKHYSLEIPLMDVTTLLGITLRGLFFLLLEICGRAPHR
ncbi:MAG: glycosyltransferase family 2 protein [Candidatus Omnitrophica bacterium]|nr:MAG: N-acetylglucosaminyl-diphospho-decaprenol L-rhamnosyltransferase [Candidatus Hinthialibacteria bacterium OLB16]MBE7486879.1 glycosyltransferase family 2 protein [bacterium]MBK7495391.1 glycosyltransferase family 2 protein [Candidatus Omnitrophota bacterium]MCE7906729.1 glycosyltransferase family 2 protein [Candidatus Omnitrophica bacterium COP1]MBV6480317.1 N-acetylglucosaminyl-diphospho-decaprenol L-rhamnosyltransferase [bacterium]